MPTRSKLLLTALLAALAMATAASAASARSLELAEAQDQRFTAAWTPISFIALGGLIQIRCNVTLRGSFHTRTSAKMRGSLAGYVTSATITRPCTGGEVWILNGTERPTNTLPWHIIYDSFRGTLPLITGIRTALVGSSWLIIAGGNQCLYNSTSASPAFGVINITSGTGVATGVTAENESRIPLNATLAGICPASASVSGTTSSYTDGEGGTIAVRLI
jgi:hypothetical protein